MDFTEDEDLLKLEELSYYGTLALRAKIVDRKVL